MDFSNFEFGTSPAEIHVEYTGYDDDGSPLYCWQCRQEVCTCDHDAILLDQLQRSLAAKLAELGGKPKGK